MIRIDVLDKIADNLETLDYKVEKTSKVYVYIKDCAKVILDLDIQQVRFCLHGKKIVFEKTFSFTDFEKLTHDWIKKHKLLK